MAGALLLAAGLVAQPAAAVEVFHQGFEVDDAGWLDNDDGWNGTITIDDGTATGLTAHEGAQFAVFEQGTEGGGTTPLGPFTRFDGYRDTFPGTYSAQAAVYLDTTWAAGEGFDYSVASNGADNNHQRDFIFHVTQDTSSGQLLVGGSNNTNFDPREDLETINNVAIATSGWYVFEHLFRDDGGVLAVDLNLFDASMNLLFTETRSDPSDTIPAEVGGNRYGWFTNIDVAGGIAVDATRLTVAAAVPAPTGVALVALGLLLVLRRR